MLKVQSDYDYPLVIYCSYWKYVVHFQLIYPLKMVIFHCYVSLPQGTHFFLHFQHFLTNRIAAYTTQPRSAPPIVPSKPCCQLRQAKSRNMLRWPRWPMHPTWWSRQVRQVEAGRRSRSNTSHVIPQNKWIQCETRMFEGVYFILRGRAFDSWGVFTSIQWRPWQEAWDSSTFRGSAVH